MSSPRSTVSTIAIAVGVLVAYALHLSQWTFLCDDAYISFRYAENLARHGEAAYNVAPLERVEGYSNPAWVAMLAVAAALGLAVPTTALVACALAGAVVLGLTVALVHTVRGGPWAATSFAPTVLVLAPEFVVWGSGGLETMSVVAAGLGAWLALEHRRWVGAAALAALALLTRADAIVWLAPLLGIRGLQLARESAPRPDARTWVVALAVLVLPVLAHLGWRWSYYGQWWPNTWTIKAHGGALRATWGAAYVGAWATAVLAPAAVLLAASHRRDAWARWLAPALAAGANVAWAWWVGGDFMAYGRFVLPATVLLGIATGLAWGSLVDGTGVSRGRRSMAIGLGVVLVAAGLARAPHRVAEDAERPWLDGRFETVRAMDMFAAERVAAGRALADRFPADTRVVVGAAGAMPWASRLPTWDAYGLVDPDVMESAHVRDDPDARPGHQVTASAAYLRGLEPDLLCHVGAVVRDPPPRREAVRRGGPGADWACVQTGTLPARIRGDRSSRYYCCVRPASARDSRPPTPLP